VTPNSAAECNVAYRLRHWPLAARDLPLVLGVGGSRIPMTGDARVCRMARVASRQLRTASREPQAASRKPQAKPQGFVLMFTLPEKVVTVIAALPSP
jgi:hypothetical protein